MKEIRVPRVPEKKIVAGMVPAGLVLRLGGFREKST